MIYLIGLLLLACIIGFNIWYASQNGLYTYAKKHITAYSLLIVCLVVYLLFFDGLSHIVKAETIQGLIDNVVSNYIVVVAFVVVYVLERFLQNRFEDKEKLRQDYFALAEKYKGDNLISCGDITYPVANKDKNRYDPCPFSYSIVDPNDLPQRQTPKFAPNKGRPQKTLITRFIYRDKLWFVPTFHYLYRNGYVQQNGRFSG